jgi:hypothetical protein
MKEEVQVLGSQIDGISCPYSYEIVPVVATYTV